MANVMIGADPEMFLRRDNTFVSAHGLIPGTKENPHQVNRGAVQVDGMAVEFNINPANNVASFRANIRGVRNQLEKMLEGYEVVAKPIAYFTDEYMRSQPKEALELGCEPDFNAYTGQSNPRPNGEVNFRTAGGHVHIGWTTDVPKDHPDHVEACRMLARELDYYIGVPSMFWDGDNGRREMYGQAGAFRPKSYGMEYRSLSNAWLNDERIITFVFNQAQRAFRKLARGESLYNQYSGAAARAMSDNDYNLANQILRIESEILGEQASILQDIAGENGYDLR